jgi:hypothetical protein
MKELRQFHGRKDIENRGSVFILILCSYKTTRRHIPQYCKFNAVKFIKKIPHSGVDQNEYVLLMTLTFQSLAVTLHTTGFNVKKFYVVPTSRLCVLYESQNKQQLLPYKTLRDWFL